jgi:hypothetical protein
LLTSPDLLLSGLIEPRFVYADASLNGNRRHHALGAHIENAWLWVPEEQTAEQLPRPGNNGSSKIAAD